ncbi:MAG TPA: autotransporter-associated beta strand repeat-containing protein, partial [Lacunisphaera sp.]|nr:autotransporter-associated beta strand repeat-containing protein [Lacunisphaera sp.]
MTAATINWDGGAGTGSWTTPNNWSNNSAWSSANTANFDTDLAGGQYSINLGSAQAARNITFSSGTANQGFTFSGSALTINNSAGIVNNDNDTQTFNNALTLGTGQTWSAASGNLVFNGNVTNGTNLLTLSAASGKSGTIAGVLGSGSGGVTKSGAGTWTMSGANTYTGVTTISAGVLSVSTLANGGVASGIGMSTNAANRLVLSGGTLQYTGSTVSTNRAFTLTNSTNSSIDVSNAGTNLTISGSSAATSGGLIKIGAGTLTLSGTNQYTGITTINSGTLSVATIGNGGVAGNLGKASNAA